MPGRDETLEKLDALISRMDVYLDRDQNSATQTVIHHTAGATSWHVASVVASFFAIIFLAIMWGHFEREMNKQEAAEQAQIDQLKAWSDIYRGKIATLETKSKGQ